ncbi:hypothetical protein VNI00_016644 [Paramarasmius palmivorus]|uniref:Uncharacterized protein n=1 Tax=Paramarasmius palmivorus TaxID=297713 RepID=A0AAW0BBZ1_9AGAR
MPYGINSRKIHGGTFNDVGRDQTNNTYHGVVGHHVQIESMTVGCSHASQALFKRTIYDEFRQVLLGDVIALQNVHHEDLSRYEWQVRGGKFLGCLKAHATTQTVQLFPHGGTQFTVIKYDGADAEKAWKRDFETFSEARTASHFPFPAPVLTPSDMEYTPVTSMQVKDLGYILKRFSLIFHTLVKKCLDNLLDDMQGLAKQLDLSRKGLDDESSPKEWDQVLQQLLHILHVWGCEIDSEAGKKNWREWVRVKDSGSIQELDDDSEDMSNTGPSHSSISVQGSGTHKRKRNTSGSMEKQEPFAEVRANKRFKPALSKKQRLLENARKRPGLQAKKLRGQ